MPLPGGLRSRSSRPGLVWCKIPSRSASCLFRCLFMTEADPSGPRHVAVMPAEVLHWLAASPGQVLVDATAGAGGHALLLARAVAPLTLPSPPGGEGRVRGGR